MILYRYKIYIASDNLDEFCSIDGHLVLHIISVILPLFLCAPKETLTICVP